MRSIRELSWVVRGHIGVALTLALGTVLGEKLESASAEFIDAALVKFTFSDVGLFLLRLKPETRANLLTMLREIARLEREADIARAVLFPEIEDPS